ncbi:MAG: helix-turn-helix transcriptional regulator [Clostridia bacterium]|nr:helix-turn-helix transcriptional regulator [Clostridia bacterium]
MLPYFENNPNKIFISYCTESYDFKSHFHRHLEIVYCFDGIQNVKAGDKIYTLKKGDALLIFPNTVHEYIRQEASPAESISLIGEADFFTAVFPELRTKVPEMPFIPASQVPENAANAFRKMVDAEDPTELLGWSFVVLSGLMKNMQFLPAPPTDSYGIAPKMISYINLHFQEPLTVRSLSKTFGYHPSYIAHVFCDRLKTPFRTYLGAVRSEHAARLISETEKSLTEIAYECGYSSQNTFCRCFKKHYGKTPSQYKKEMKREAAQ